jgi:hypothetical protein
VHSRVAHSRSARSLFRLWSHIHQVEHISALPLSRECHL